MGCIAAKSAPPAPTSAPTSANGQPAATLLQSDGLAPESKSKPAASGATGAGNPSATCKVKVQSASGLAYSTTASSLQRLVCLVELVGKPGSRQSTEGAADAQAPAWHAVLEVAGYTSGDELLFAVVSPGVAQPEQLGWAKLSAAQVFAGFVGELALSSGAKLLVTVDGTDPTLAQEVAHITEEVGGLTGAFSELTKIFADAVGKVLPLAGSVGEDGNDLVQDAGKLAGLAKAEVSELIEEEAVLCKC